MEAKNYEAMKSEEKKEKFVGGERRKGFGKEKKDRLQVMFHTPVTTGHYDDCCLATIIKSITKPQNDHCHVRERERERERKVKVKRTLLFLSF